MIKCPGDSVTFSVAATGTGLSYQWRKNSANIAGATNSAYSITNVAAGNAGYYDYMKGLPDFETSMAAEGSSLAVSFNQTM